MKIPTGSRCAAALAFVLTIPVTALAAEAPLPEDGTSAEEPEYVTWGSLVDNGQDRVNGRFIGLTGGIILGAEVVISVEAVLRVKKVWPYVTFPLLGAAGGGVGGYFLEQSSPAGAVTLLILGIACAIPTAILVKRAMAFDPYEEGAVSDDLDDGERYSFEKPPKEIGAPEDRTTTEVEQRPDGPPSPTTTPQEPPADPEANRRHENTPETAASASGGHGAPQKTPADSPSRKATTGSLIYVEPGGNSGLAMPRIDVRPARRPRTFFSPPRPRSGISVFVMLLHIDLP